MKKPRSSPRPLILIVDDSEDNRELYAQYLLYLGCRVEVARDGVEALDRVMSLLPDLVLLDLSMPAIDGWEVARRLKVDPKTRKIPVIAVTGHAFKELEKRAREAGVDAYLTKPLLPAKLVEEANKALAAAGKPTC